MENKIIAILLTALLVAMAPATVFAIGFPHDTTSPTIPPNPATNNNYKCSSCHAAHNTLGTTGFNNVCLSCHNGADPKAYKRFAEQDAANPYGTITSGRTNPYQTSHNWAGPDVNPAAGAQAPVDPLMTTATTQGYLLCVRCHNVHGTMSSATNSRPLLRVRNDNDQMCRDCHAARDKNSHMFGTHPINVSYSTARTQALYADDYQYAPVANPSNPSSEMRLKNGKVQCTTCHGVHYTDSNRDTLDNYSSGTFNRLSTSSGFLLRTNARGKNPDDINICTNCHAAKQAHNGGGQNVQCDDCHAGHVEYDKNAVTADEKIPNKYIIRRYMNYSGGVKLDSYRKRVFYRYTGATTKEFFVSADRAVGVCQACHNETDKFKKEHYVDGDPSKGLKDDHGKDKCKTCHPHRGQSFKATCNTCHGYPPTINVKGGGSPGGYAVWSTATNQASRVYALDESRTPHATHADGSRYVFACAECHNGNYHNNGDFRQVFRSKVGIIAGIQAQYSAPSTSRYNCSNMYCHSNAQATPTYAVVNWKDTKDTISRYNPNRCNACHGDKSTIGAVSTSLSDAHQRHAAPAQANYACQNCHALTLKAYAFANNTGLIYPAKKHVNGSKDVSFSVPTNTVMNNLIAGASYDSVNQTCSTVYCHSNGRGGPGNVAAKWTDQSSGQCGACHSVVAFGPSAAFGVISSGAHFKHLSTTYGPQMQLKVVFDGGTGDLDLSVNRGCLVCHTLYSGLGQTGHVNGDKAADSSAGSGCYKCHGGLQQGTLPAWTDKERIACTRCHPIWDGYSASRLPNGLAAPKQVNYSSTGHGKSIAPYNKMACTSCHDQNSAHFSNPPILGDNNRLIAFSFASSSRNGTNAVCNNCHWPGQSAQNRVRFTHVTSVSEAVNNSPSMACSRCHDVHGSSNFGMIRDQIAFKANSSAFIYYSSSFFTNYSAPDSTVVKSRTPKPGPYKFIQTEAPYMGVCQVCHTKTMHFRRGRDEAVDGPSSGTFNTNTVPPSSITSHRNMSKDTNCLSCHQHNPPAGPDVKNYAFYPFGKCDACHGYPPIPKSYAKGQGNYSSGKFEDYTGAGGSHVFQGHVPKTADPSQSWDLCSSCHQEEDHLSVSQYYQVKVKINPNLRFNTTNVPAIAAQYTSNRLDGTNHQTGTCYNVSCHFQKTPKWGTP